MFGYDDALDTFGVHAVGGTLGAFMTGILATAKSGNANITDAGAAAKANGLAKLVAEGGLWVEQLKQSQSRWSWQSWEPSSSATS